MGCLSLISLVELNYSLHLIHSISFKYLVIITPFNDLFYISIYLYYDGVLITSYVHNYFVKI